MLKKFVFAAAALSLSACAWFAGPPTDAPDTTDTTVTKTTLDSDKSVIRENIRFEGLRATPAERAMCQAAGGKVVMAGLRGGDNCIRPYADGGKACSDNSECEGRCYVVGEYPGAGEKTSAGQCAPNDNLFGCRADVTNGRAGGTLCVD